MPNFSINMDTGGTFTDGFLTSDAGQYWTVKVRTTPQNPAISFVDCLRKLAASASASVEELLAQTTTIVYATTRGTNTLIQRRGPKLGLITTSGFEDIDRRRRSRGKADGLSWEEVKHSNRIRKPEPLIPRWMIEGVIERIDCLGNIVIPLDEESVRRAVRELVDRGAEGFVVNLMWSPRNAVHERRIREIIYEDFPESHLGSVPVILASELSPTRGEYGRGETAIVNAYLHRDLAEFVREIEEILRRMHCPAPLFLVQNNGGVARTIKTSALRLWNSGPVAGTSGSQHIADVYGMNNVALIDMGGTSCDVAVYNDGVWDYSFEPIADRFRLSLQILDVTAIGAGGGSIATCDRLTGTLTVGPRSAEAVPGPACYGLGGDEPTVTDADIVLGYLDPANFLGGEVDVFPELAETSIERYVAEPMGLSIPEAAMAIRRIVDGHMTTLLYRHISARGLDPREFTLLAYGGAGPVHAADVARDLNIGKIMTFPFSAQFCAFGAACSDIVHQYQSARRIALFDYATQRYLDNLVELNNILDDLEVQAIRDFHAEGFSDDEIVFEYEYAMRFGRQLGDFVVRIPFRRFTSVTDVKDVCAKFVAEYNEFFGAAAAYLEAGIEVKSIVLWARVPRPRPSMEFAPPVAEFRSEPVSERHVWFVGEPDFVQTPVFADMLLPPGFSVRGPAIVERPDTAVLIPPCCTFEKDRHGSGTLAFDDGESSSGAGPAGAVLAREAASHDD